MKTPVSISIDEKTLEWVDRLSGGVIPRSRILEAAINRGMTRYGNTPLVSSEEL